jgi:hypothetical protein
LTETLPPRDNVAGRLALGGLMQALIPLIVVAVVLSVMAFMRFRQGAVMGNMENQYAHARAGAVAQRMGLQLVAGDPNFHFYINPRLKQGHEALYGNKAIAPECVVQMQGMPAGRRVEMLYHDHMELEKGLLERTLHTSFDARLTVAVNAPFPAFEVHTRNPNEYVKLVPQLALPPQTLGDAALDQALVLKAADPRIGPVIGPALRLLGQTQYVHILGQEGALVFRYTQMASMGMGDADKALPAMDEMARAIEQAAAAIPR